LAFGEDQWSAVKIMNPVVGTQARQIILVHPQRIAARIIGAYPQIVIARDQGLGARELVEEGEAAAEMIASAQIPAEQKQIGRVNSQMLHEQVRGRVTRRVVAPVQIRSHGNAHVILHDSGIVSAGWRKKSASPQAGSPMGLPMEMENGPPAIPSLPNGPEVLFFSPKVEDIPT